MYLILTCNSNTWNIKVVFREKEESMDITKVLPADCIANIISLTSPKDACRSSCVCSFFKAAQESDDVWERFLPSDYEDIMAQSSHPSLPTSLTKRQIFFHLFHHTVFLNNGQMV